MTISLKHSFESGKGDGLDSTLVQPSNWNAEHVLTQSGDTVLGKDSGDGATAEFSWTAFGRSIIAAANAAAVNTLLGLSAVATAGTYASLTSKPTTIAGFGLTDAAAKSQTFDEPVFIEAAADKDYRIVVDRKFAGTITEVTTRCESGTCTLTVKVNTTALGGTANSVSSSEQTQAHASANSFSAGDDIVLTVSSNSACVGMSINIKYTRTMS